MTPDTADPVSPRPGLDDLLLELGCGALLVVAKSSRDPHIAPFVGAGRIHRSFVLAPRGALPRLGYFTPMERGEAAATGLDLLTPEELDILRWSRDGGSPAELLGHVLSRAFHLCQLAPGPVAVAGSLPAGELVGAFGLLAGEGWSFVPGEGVVERLSKRKTPRQVAAVARAAEGTCEAFRRVAESLAAARIDDGELWLAGERLRVGRLRSLVARTLAEHGLEQPWGNIVAPAEEGAVPHNSGRDERVLRPRESLIVDIFPRGLLAADCTRTFCVGEPPAVLTAGHAQVRRALETVEPEARPGAWAWDLQQQVSDFFVAAGWPTSVSHPGTERGYVHGLGHGVGFEIHEMPSFRREANPWEGRLEVGDVLTLEPGLYEPDEGWAVRLENLYVVEEDGPRNLTPLPYDLDPRAWSLG